MRSRYLFWAGLFAFILIHTIYGLKRFSLGVDFTDEGAYISWPLRMLFGERLFESEVLTLLRPLQALLYALFKLHPTITLYEFRIIGWSLHLLSFSVLSYYLFRLSDAPWQSLLIASVPVFVCNIFGLASPSYNSLSSDFLAMALSWRGLSLLHGTTRGKLTGVTSGLALFVATLAHPGLGLVAAALIVHDLLAHDLAQNLFRRKLTGPNISVLVFVSCWIVFVAYLAASGALAVWIERTALFRSFGVTSKEARPASVYWQLATYPFSYSRLAMAATGSGLALAAAARVFARNGQDKYAERSCLVLGILLPATLVATFSFEIDFLPTCFVFVSLFLIGIHVSGILKPTIPVDADIRFLLLMSGLGAACCAALSFYFNPYRSWVSGLLGLPFAFSVGLTLLVRFQTTGSGIYRALTVGALALAVTGAAREHYRNIYRDAPPAELQSNFHLPQLARITSTQERVRSVDALYDYLRPKLSRGEPLLAFDDCPMLYFLLEAKPVYGLTWASRYAHRPASLRQLNHELLAHPLPRFAIRTVVDLSNPVWSSAPRTDYSDYPLNETVTHFYELERTVFPFEIWRLKPPGAPEKTSPQAPAR